MNIQIGKSVPTPREIWEDCKAGDSIMFCNGQVALIRVIDYDRHMVVLDWKDSPVYSQSNTSLHDWTYLRRWRPTKIERVT